MREYIVLRTHKDYIDTQSMLNDYAQLGWELVCSYCGGMWFVMGREVKHGRRISKLKHT